MKIEDYKVERYDTGWSINDTWFLPSMESVFCWIARQNVAPDSWGFTTDLELRERIRTEIFRLDDVYKMDINRDHRFWTFEYSIENEQQNFEV